METQKEETSIFLFRQLMEKISSYNYQQLCQLWDHDYNIKELKLNRLEPWQASNLFQSLNHKLTRMGHIKAHHNSLSWVENQLRLFVLALLSYLAINSKRILNLTESDWEFFHFIFQNKEPSLFEYQSKCLLKTPCNKIKWDSQQDYLYLQLINDYELEGKWSQLAKLLYIKSNKNYFRSPKQCRERWLNHLDPNKCKLQWLEEEDYILLEYVKIKGKKWAAISKLLQKKRSQHSVKNRFNSLLAKEEKSYGRDIPSKETLLNNILNRLKQKRKTTSKVFTQLTNLQNTSIPKTVQKTEMKPQSFKQTQAEIVVREEEEYFRCEYLSSNPMFQEQSEQQQVRFQQYLNTDIFSSLKEVFSKNNC